MSSFDHLAIFLYDLFQLAFGYVAGLVFIFAASVGVLSALRHIFKKSQNEGR